MSLHQNHQRPRRRVALHLAVGALTLGAVAAVPTGAFASTVAGSNGTLTYRTGVGEQNDLTITQSADGQTLTFSDAAVKVQADPTSGCTPAGNGVTCPTPQVATGAVGLDINLGDGNDRLDNNTNVRSDIDGSDGDDTILGSHVRDVITGATGRDTIDGREGDDLIITGGSFPDTVACGPGTDTVRADASDTVASDCETIQRVGAPGETPAPVDTTRPGGVTKPDADAGQVVPTPIPGACMNNIGGTRSSDILTGTAGGDNILALGGRDRVNALGGDDCVFGGSGNDRLSGGSGRDFLSGEAGSDNLSASSGRDGLSGGSGNDRLSGGSDDDRLAGDTGRDVLVGGGGRDRLYGGGGNDRLSGGGGIDRLYGGSGNDRLSGGSGSNVLRGGSGRDVISAHNGVLDRIDCGSGRDLVRADRRDRVARNCEVVRR